MTIKDNPQQKETVNRVQGVAGQPAPTPDPNQRILEKKPDGQSPGRRGGKEEKIKGKIGAGEEDRTLDIHLGKVALHQLRAIAAIIPTLIFLCI